jgi:hypothetical protein
MLGARVASARRAAAAATSGVSSILRRWPKRVGTSRGRFPS